MSALDVSAGATLPFTARASESLGRPAPPADGSAPPNFSDLIAKMGPDAATMPSAPTATTAERWSAWREQLLQQGIDAPPVDGEGDLVAGGLVRDAMGDPFAADTQKPDQSTGDAAAVPAGVDALALAALALPVEANAGPSATPAPRQLAASPMELASDPGSEPSAPDEMFATETDAQVHWRRLAVLGQETHLAPVRQTQLGPGVPDLATLDAAPTKAQADTSADVAAGRQLSSPVLETSAASARQPLPRQAASVPMLRDSAPADLAPQVSAGEGVETDAPGTGGIGKEGIEQPRSAGAASASSDQPAAESERQPERGEVKPRRQDAAAVGDAADAVSKDIPRSAAATSPMQQVAGRIVATAVSLQNEPARADVSPIHTAPAPVVKVLHLQLQPDDLGTITIRMSLKGDALEIRLEASRSETAGMLQRDQDALAKLIGAAGYRIEGMLVSSSGSDSAQFADGRQSGFSQSSMSGQSGSSQSDARSSGGREGAPQESRQFRGAQNGDGEKGGAARNAGGGIYV
ncbi:MAG: flagellar hook-length control protein FliK [Hyphomicrobiaceae bacterium]